MMSQASTTTDRRIVLTGVTGFIGSALAHRLAKSGWCVHAIIRPTSDAQGLGDLDGRVTVHRFGGDVDSLADALRSADAQVVVHLASLFLKDHTPADVLGLIDSNIRFGTQVVEAMLASRLYRLVNTGTYWQHYRNAVYSPVNLYAATKQAFEAILQYYWETTPLQVTTLSLYDVYGPGDRRPKLLNLLRQMARNQQPLAMSPGEQLIDMVYLDDVVEAYVLAVEHLLARPVGPTGLHEEFAVSSGQPLPLKEIVALYERVVGRTVPVTWSGRPYRTREVMVPWNCGRPLPGWRPKVGIEEGIRRTEGLS